VAGLVAMTLRPLAPPVPPTDVAVQLTSFPEVVLDRVMAWVGPIRLAFWPRVAATLGLPVLLVATATGRRLVDRFGGVRLATTRGIVLPQLVAALAAAPLTWWLSWRHAGTFGFRTAGPVRFVLEEVGAVALSIAVTTVTVLLLLWLLRRRPHDWPAVGTLLGTVLTAALVLVQPLVVNTVLYDPVPLEDPAVRAVVEPVVARSTLPDTELLVGDASVRTTRVNAFVSGLGPSQQVVLWDTLLELPEDRIAAVVGHELAHAEHRYRPRGVLASATGLLLSLTLAGVVLRRIQARTGSALPLRGARAGAVAVVVVLVAQFVASPVVAWQSRRVEAAADARALELTRDPAAQVALQRGFVVDDLSDPTPPTWVELLQSHPTPAERIRRAAAFGVEAGLDPVP
jgi:STE24 endopeptidase